MSLIRFLLRGRCQFVFGSLGSFHSHEKRGKINLSPFSQELKIPPGNQLEPLLGDRKGQYSICINEQYRICFIRATLGLDQAEIVDYH